MNEGIAKFVDGFTKNQLIGYFLILWAATFLFSAINGFAYIIGGHASLFDVLLDGVWSLTKLGIAAVLAMLGLKILEEKVE